jgi:hypothetical protein
VNKKYIVWIVAAGLVVLGGIMMLIAGLNGAHGVSYTENGFHVYGEKYSENLELSGAIREIEAKIAMADITLAPATDGKFRVEYFFTEQKPPNIIFNNGKLTITSEQNERWGINLPGMSTWNEINYVKIYFPEGSEFDRIDIDNGLGSVTATDVRSETRTDIVLNLGNLKLDGGVYGGQTTLHNDMGNIDFSGDLLGSAEITNNMGNIDFSGNLLGNAEVTDNMGDVTLRLDGAAADYEYELAVDLGNIYVDGIKIGTHTERYSVGAENFFEVKANMGNITVRFGH